MAQIKAYDPRFPNANDTMILAWSRPIAKWQLALEDCVHAVDTWFESHGASAGYPLVADIVRLARDRRNSRMERLRPDDRPVIDKAAPDETPEEIEVARQARAELDRVITRIAAERAVDRTINALPTETCLHCQQTLTRSMSGLYLHADGKVRCSAMPPALLHEGE